MSVEIKDNCKKKQKVISKGLKKENLLLISLIDRYKNLNYFKEEILIEKNENLHKWIRHLKYYSIKKANRLSILQ